MITESVQPLYRLVFGVVSEKGISHDTNEDSYRADPERGLFISASNWRAPSEIKTPGMISPPSWWR
ncbi:MAG: hypothetical protein N2556_05890 [Anaerolineae bacterium]|nr:hypothetical protein [Anaerolineae bacterium]